MSAANRSVDAIVIGAGAVGTSVAYHLARAGVRVLLLEKESSPARHQSGRNSGVIHAGYNLKPGSNKAKYCVEGNRRLRAYCEARGVPMMQGGILVVARRDAEVQVLHELARRATANGVAASIVDGVTLRQIEPHAAGVAALHAPEGASLDARAYVECLAADAAEAGAEIRYRVRAGTISERGLGGRGAADVSVSTSIGQFAAGVLVNCGGLHADRLAGPLARDLRILPFRGYYAELHTDRRHLVRSHVYGAPDLAFPFLGVHASRQADGSVLIGPGAMLAFGREAYRFHSVHWRDLTDTVTWPGFHRLLAQRRFRALIASEVKKSLSLGAIWREATALLPELRRADLRRSTAGNRAQLVTRDGTLVDDILVRETERTVHVLNAVSPGLTGSLPFGEHIATRALAKLEGR